MRIWKDIKNRYPRFVALFLAGVFLCSCSAAAVGDTSGTSGVPPVTSVVTSAPPDTSTASDTPDFYSSDMLSDSETDLWSDSIDDSDIIDLETYETDDFSDFGTETDPPPATETDPQPPVTTPPKPVTVNATGKYRDYVCKTDAKVALYDYTDSELLYASDLYAKVYPASVTKIFTVTFARTMLGTDHIITIGDEIKLISAGSSTAGMKIGDRFYFGDILYALLLPSGNDVAYAIATECGRIMAGDMNLAPKKAISTFITGLNQFLKNAGVKKTNILTPDGIASTRHFTCLHDLIIVAKLVLADEVLANVVSTYTKTIVSLDGREKTYYNTNPFLRRSTEENQFIGLKTGHTNLSKWNIIVASRQRDGHVRLALCFGAETAVDRRTEIESVLKFGLEKAEGSYTGTVPKPTTESQTLPPPPDTESDTEPIPPDTQSDTEPIPPDTESDTEPLPPDTESDTNPLPPDTESDTESVPPDAESDTEPLPHDTESDTEPPPPDTESETESDPVTETDPGPDTSIDPIISPEF